MKPPQTIRLTPGKRVLFLTKDPDLIRRQLAGELDLRMEDLRVEDLLDDINTDAMTPAWVCFSHRPEDIARDAYAGLIVDGKRLFERDALSERQLRGHRLRLPQGGRQLARDRGPGREVVRHPHRHRRLLRADPRRATTSARACSWATTTCSGASRPARASRSAEFYEGSRPDHPARHPRKAACSRSPRRWRPGEVELPRPDTGPRPMTMAEKILARHMLGVPRASATSSPATPWSSRSTAATPTSSPPPRSTTSSSRSTGRTTRSRTPTSSRSSRTT